MEPVRIAFEPRVRLLSLEKLLPSKILPAAVMESVKYKRIAASVAEVGVVEPLVVAQAGADALIDVIRPYGPWAALFVFYGVTLFATDILSNATVAVLFSPIAVAIAAALGVDARPFLVAVMMAASAAFATPFSYQTNVLVYQMGNYSYMDFVKVGLPLNLITWATGMAAIPIFFPF